MTVYFETLKPAGMHLGETPQVRKIIEEDDCIVLWHSENWQTFLSKDMYKIVHISY